MKKPETTTGAWRPPGLFISLLVLVEAEKIHLHHPHLLRCTDTWWLDFLLSVSFWKSRSVNVRTSYLHTDMLQNLITHAHRHTKTTNSEHKQTPTCLELSWTSFPTRCREEKSFSENVWPQLLLPQREDPQSHLHMTSNPKYELSLPIVAMETTWSLVQ